MYQREINELQERSDAILKEMKRTTDKARIDALEDEWDEVMSQLDRLCYYEASYKYNH